jgi:phenylpropionate dioxygenase-like ring-hydroxylating dioxygenase large terminal subunit
MVFVPTRGDLPIRFGPGAPPPPAVGPSVLDHEVYRDPARYERERTRILNRSWQLICRSEQIPDPGDHIVWEGHGETILITRQDDGTLAGFHNVCAHRGARIVPPGTGKNARRYTCRWHNWTYDTHGNVRGIPDRPDFDPHTLHNLCAPPLDLTEWGGWIWTVLAGPAIAEPFTDWLGKDIAGDLNAFHMEDMTLVEKVEWEVDVNWKVCIDAFSEYYHAQALHQIPSTDVKDARQSTIDVFGRHGIMVVPVAGVLPELRETLDHQRLATCNYVLFPTVTVNSTRLHTQVFRAVPLSVDKTRFEAWELRYQTDDEDYLDYVEAAWEVYKVIIQQDVDEWVDLTATARSSAYRRSVLSERECLITHFHRVCDDMLAGGTGLGLEPARTPVGQEA